MDEKIKTEIPLSFTGESEAVEQLEGSLVTNKDAIEVECLPTDLVSEIEVNISSLKTFEDTIKISDLKIPANIEILHDQDEIIALVEEPRSEEELAELEEKSAEEEEKEALEKMGAETEAENREAKEGEAGEEKEDSEQSAPTEPDNKEK
jgi:large subunit ribosomal protein L25